MDPNQNKKESSATEEIQQNLKSTEFGQFLSKNTKLLVAIGVIISLVLIAIPIMNNLNKEKDLKLAGEIYKLELELAKFQKDELAFEKIHAKILEFDKTSSTEKSSAMFFVGAAKTYHEKGKVDEAINLLSSKSEKYSTNPYISFFYNQLLAVMFEEKGNIDKAINSLEKIVGGSTSILTTEAKFNLGRLYNKKGDKVKAKEKFEDVIKIEEKSAQIYKMSKVFLKEL